MISEKSAIFNSVKIKLLAAVPELAEKLAPIYRHLAWQWCSHSKLTESYIPTAKDIMEVLIRLITAYESNHISSSTGGLTVEIKQDEAGMWEGKMYMEIGTSVYVAPWE